MMKPTRLVMSMVPNKSYLEGYNQCVEDADRYSDEVKDLLLKVLKTHCPVDCLEHAGLLEEVQDFLLEETRSQLDKRDGSHRVSATPYDVDMDLEKDEQ